MVGRNGRDAQIDRGLAFVRAELDTAILREPLFCDVEARHDLETTDDRSLKALRWIGHDLEHTVDAVAEAEPLFQRFQMNIARLEAVGLKDHQIDEAENVGVVAALATLFVLALFFDNEFVALIRADEALHHFIGAAVVAFLCAGDLFGGDDDGIDIEAEFLAQGVDGIEIKGIRESDAEMLALECKRHHPQAERQLAGNRLEGLLWHDIDPLEELDAGLGSRRAQDIDLGDQSAPDQFLNRAVAVFTGGTARILQVRRLDQAVLDQEFENEIVVGSHSLNSFYKRYHRKMYMLLLLPTICKGCHNFFYLFTLS